MTDTDRTLAEIGELAFLRAIRERMPPDGGPFPRSVGDDCLVTGPFGGDELLATTDTFVDTVHFTRDLLTFEEIGGRAMAASVSDIAAMAGEPVFSLVALSMPKDTVFGDALSLCDGLHGTARRYGCPVAGGETTSTPGPLTVTVTVVGRCAPGKAVRRSGARPGDALYLTGTIGGAMAGLAALQEKVPGFDGLKRKFAEPEALVDTARSLAEAYRITAMIDVSDGVATDLAHICGESGCGASVDSLSIPLPDEFVDFAEKRGFDPVGFALGSGEEFELLFASSDTALSTVKEVGGRRITKIGWITEKNNGITVARPDGSSAPLTARGYEHFT